MSNLGLTQNSTLQANACAPMLAYLHVRRASVLGLRPHCTILHNAWSVA
jgi:hypothetical protein